MKTAIIEAIAQRPLMVRELFRDPEVLQQLESIGVLVTTYELHARSRGSRICPGLGPTLCQYHRARRHPTLVTCQKCLAKMERKRR